MVMALDFNFVAYTWIITILMVLFAVAGCFVVATSFRDHNRRREERMKRSPDNDPWDAGSHGSFDTH
jgi:hypothetical protein